MDHVLVPSILPRPLYHFYFAWRVQIGVLLFQSRPNSAYLLNLVDKDSAVNGWEQLKRPQTCRIPDIPLDIPPDIPPARFANNALLGVGLGLGFRLENKERSEEDQRHY